MNYLSLAITGGLCLLLTGCQSLFTSKCEGARFEKSDAPSCNFTFIRPAAEANRKIPVAAFNKTHTNRCNVKRAVIWATSLGSFELFINDKLVQVIEGDGRADYLRPGFTDVRKRRSYCAYDITDLWTKESAASNDISAFVACSWYSDLIGAETLPPSFAAKLELTFEDGSKELLETGTDWSASYDTAFVRAGIYEGEKFDARLARTAKECAGEKKAVVESSYKGIISRPVGAGVRLREDLALAPVEMYIWKEAKGAVEGKAFGKIEKIRQYLDGEEIKLNKGEFLVIDFGQNAAAIPSFTASAPKGTTLSLKSAEMLNDANGEISRGNDGPAGSIYRKNLRSIKGNSLAVYIFNGDAEESYRPSFTFQGYRYLQLFANNDLTIKSIRSIPVTSIARADERGTIETGNPDVNKLIKNIRWGMYSNYLSVPTDCPQRDERHGWTADTQVFACSALYSADVYNFLRKWMQDVRDAQKNGKYPSVAPWGNYMDCGLGKFGWADAGIIVPWTAWRMTGDTKIIEENLASMEIYMKVQQAAKGNLSLNANYSDWLSYESVTKPDMTAKEKKELTKTYWAYLSACYWMQNSLMMSDMCKALKVDDSKYVTMAQEAKAHIKSLIFDEKGFMLKPFSQMQTPQLFALKLGLYDNKKTKMSAIRALNNNFRINQDCLQTGFLGTSILMDTVTYNYDRPDLAYTLLMQRKNPSWLYSVDNGATTIWERWNSYTIEEGFGNAGMNSFNHYAYGAVLEWMYKSMAGIQPGAKGGFDEFILAPVTDPRLDNVKASFRTNKGLIKSQWYYDGNECVFSFTVPKGSKALVKFAGKEKVYTSGSYTLKGIN